MRYEVRITEGNSLQRFYLQLHGHEEHRGEMIMCRIYRTLARLKVTCNSLALVHCVDRKESATSSVVLCAFSAALCGLSHPGHISNMGSEHGSGEMPGF